MFSVGYNNDIDTTRLENRSSLFFAFWKRPLISRENVRHVTYTRRNISCVLWNWRMNSYSEWRRKRLISPGFFIVLTRRDEIVAEKACERKIEETEKEGKSSSTHHSVSIYPPVERVNVHEILRRDAWWECHNLHRCLFPVETSHRFGSIGLFETMRLLRAPNKPLVGWELIKLVHLRHVQFERLLLVECVREIRWNISDRSFDYAIVSLLFVNHPMFDSPEDGKVNELKN